MKKLFLLTILLFLLNFLYADNNKEIYLNLLKQEKYKELFEHLNKWEKSDPKNPEVFIGYFNYYIKIGSKSGLAIESKPKGKEQLEILDKNNKIVGYFNNSTIYNYEEIKHAFEYINKGLEYNPNRLDMYFGKIYLLGEIKDFKTQGNILIDVLNLSIQNKNNWLWSDNKQLKSGENFLLDNIQDYYHTWFEDKTEESLDSIKKASSIEIKLYPKCIMGYSNLANYYTIKKQYNDALKLLIDAEKIDDNDIVIINNIANCYKDLNNKEMAKKYFEKMVKIGDEDTKNYAKKMLEKL